MSGTDESGKNLVFQTLYNIRDLGGHPTRDGRATRYGRFLRSDAPVRLNRHELDQLLAIPVSQVIDLRSPAEISQLPHLLSGHPLIEYVNISLLGTDLDEKFDQLERNHAKNNNKRPELVDLYHHMLDDAKQAIGRVMHHLSSDQSGARLFHCSHGKDRTGLISALLLLLADVPDSVIVADYQISETNLQPWFQTILHQIPSDHQRYLTTPAVYMEKTLDYLYKNYGSVSDYLLRCGVTEQTQNRLKQLLLEDI
ncbi:MAG: tyrosine-protein phosphatase [Eubacteriales bacterium]|nr:tyrosine-protein phosphatase [Eubacteriales bacterium]